MNAYPPITLPEFGTDRAAVAREYGLPPDLYTNGLYLTRDFLEADAALSRAMKARLPSATVRSYRDRRESAWREIIDGIREAANHESAVREAFGDHGQG